MAGIYLCSGAPQGVRIPSTHSKWSVIYWNFLTLSTPTLRKSKDCPALENSSVERNVMQKGALSNKKAAAAAGCTYKVLDNLHDEELANGVH